MVADVAITIGCYFHIFRLEDAFVAVKDYNSTVSMEDLEPIPYQVSTSLEFNDEDQTAFDGLDINWEWKPIVSACEKYFFKTSQIFTMVKLNKYLQCYKQL